MDSQGRTRLIVGALSLAAVLLVIALLFTQQNGRIPAAIESPLLVENGGTPPADGAVDEAGDEAAQAESPLAAAGPDSPLAVPNASDAVVTETVGAGAASTLTATVANTATTAVSVTARSTVTVTLAGPVPTTMPATAPPTMPVLYDYEVVATYRHDPTAFTQGLQYVDGVLYEGTGLNGQSTLRRVELETGVVEQYISLADEYFGEGIVVVDDRIYQLTWKSGVALLYDRASFEQIDQFSYATEGWGLTFDGEDLLMSDGSATIFRRDPATFAEEGSFTVVDYGEPVRLLNELEYIEGELWANVWQTDEVVIVDPATGAVTGKVDFSELLTAEEAARADVLNGIAYDDEHDRLFVTGKFWPTLFEIEIVPRDP